MPTVNTPTGQFNFPDGTPPEEMKAALDRHFGKGQEAAPAVKEPSWFERTKALMAQGFQEENVGANQLANQVGLGPAVGKISQALGGPPQASPKKLAGVANKLEDSRRKIERPGLMNTIAEIPGNMMTPVGIFPFGGSEEKGIAALLKGLAATGAKQGVVQGALAPSGDENQSGLGRALHAATTGAATSAGNVVLGAAGKGIGAAVGGIAKKLGAPKIAEKLADLFGEKGGENHQLFDRAGISMEGAKTAEDVQKRVFEAHDKLGEDIIGAIAPKEIGPTRQGKVSPNTLGEGFSKGYSASKTGEQKGWQKAEREAERTFLTNQELPGGAKAYTKALSDFADGLSNDVANDSKLRPLVNHIKQMLPKLGLPGEGQNSTTLRKLPVKDLVEIKKILNDNFDPKQYANRKDLPYIQVSKMTDALLDIAGQKNPAFDTAYSAAKNITSKNAATYGTDTIKKLGLDAQVVNSFRAMNRGQALNLDAEKKMLNTVDKITDAVDVKALKKALDPKDFDTVARTKVAALLADAKVNPEKFAENRNMIDEILSLSGKSKQLKGKLDDFQAIGEQLKQRGITDHPLDDSSMDTRIAAAKKGLLGLFTQHYAFAASQARNVIAPPEGAAGRRLIKLGRELKNQTPGRVGLAKTKQFGRDVAPFMRNVPGAALGRFLGQNNDKQSQDE